MAQEVRRFHREPLVFMLPWKDKEGSLVSGKMEEVVVTVVGSSHQVLHQEEKASRHRASTFPSDPPPLAGVAIYRVDLLTSN